MCAGPHDSPTGAAARTRSIRLDTQGCGGLGVMGAKLLVRITMERTGQERVACSRDRARVRVPVSPRTASR